MEQFDVLIVGGGAAGLSCALLLGSAKDRSFAAGKRIGIIANPEGSALKKAELNNVLGFEKGTRGSDVLKDGLQQLGRDYPHIHQLPDEKVIRLTHVNKGLVEVCTEQNIYRAVCVVIAVNPVRTIGIEGLESFMIPHPYMAAAKKKIMLKNTDHLVSEGIYAAGVIAGWRSQYAIAAGSGAMVATHILTEWNDGNHTVIHDVVS